jgi:hypothetical protein
MQNTAVPVTQFDVYVREEDGKRVGTAIKRGFSWPALCFTWLWAIANRLCVVAAAVAIVMTICNALWIYFLEDESPVAWLFVLVNAGIAVVVGLTGNALRRTRIEASGFHQAETISGGTPAHALATLDIVPAPSSAYSLGGVITAACFTAIAVFGIVVGTAALLAGDGSFAMRSLGVATGAGVPAVLLWYRSLRPPLGFVSGLLWAVRPAAGKPPPQVAHGRGRAVSR